MQAHPAHVSAEQQDRHRHHQIHQWSLRCGVYYIAALPLLLCPAVPAQVLPLVPPDPEYYSPYSGLDTNCGNPLLIDLAALITEGLLDPTDTPPVMPDGDVQFEKVSSQQLSRARARVRVRVQHTAGQQPHMCLLLLGPAHLVTMPQPSNSSSSSSAVCQCTVVPGGTSPVSCLVCVGCRWPR